MRQRKKINFLATPMKSNMTKHSSFKLIGSLFFASVALSLLVTQPLWSAQDSSATPAQQEESFFQGLKRSLDEWLGKDSSSNKAKEKAPKPVDPPPQSDGRKAINAIKDRMQKTSDNISESVDRDKKTLKKKLQKLDSDK